MASTESKPEDTPVLTANRIQKLEEQVLDLDIHRKTLEKRVRWLETENKDWAKKIEAHFNGEQTRHDKQDKENDRRQRTYEEHRRKMEDNNEKHDELLRRIAVALEEQVLK